MARYRHWLAARVPHGRGLRSNRLAMSWAHGIVLAFGVLTIAFGLYLLVAIEEPALPAIGTLFIGVILILIGVAETFTEGVEGRGDRRRQ